ncbi:uncharacterized protein LOC133814961 [Humulus lupulus]|uniref:uncharacterized protein LOC133814961 n=1 Tax=Humulus lupulus TaxID=3486 RepID=UPI002B411B43|nr:uncharacterized protein LOC133814961 [Humulus lupulus]
MSIFSWNCRGLGNPRAVQFLKDIICQKKPNFVFLCETLCKGERIKRIQYQLGFEGSLSVDAVGRSGGLALLWKHKEEIHLLSYSLNHIDVVVRVEGMSEWRLTGFYGEPNRAFRRRTWDLIRQLSDRSTLPWCLIGDFNNVLSHVDKKGGVPYPSWLIEGFQNVLNDCELVDMELNGYQFTWEMGAGTDRWVEVRIDRAISSHSWLQLFPMAKLFNLGISTSDHSPLFLDPRFVLHGPYVKKFRFENAWLREPLCHQVVGDAWGRHPGRDILGKVAYCGEVLGRWGKEVTGNLNFRIEVSKRRLLRLKGRRDEGAMSRFKEEKQKLFQAISQKEIFWRQRSKQLWLKAGDQNTKYFHAAASARRRQNHISRLKNASGEWVDWDSGLQDTIEAYFTELFSSSDTDWGLIVDGIQPSITDHQNRELLKPVEADEVRMALFQMHPDKSPGPDGMTPAFYQKFWSIVGSDVVSFVRSFFSSGSLPTGVNDTNVVLIPKKKNPEQMGDLRPISLCNVLYKVASKVLANRMKQVLDQVISDSQSAFIPGRLITNNIMVSFEILHYLKRKRRGSDGFMALKLDMIKAYDRVEWPFLSAVLAQMGFADRWIKLLECCLSSVRYRVVCGDKEIGPIFPGRGLRQGDPISPYLFLICAEGFSTLINQFENRGWLHGCKVARGAPRVSHMFFADDSYLYCKANEVEAGNVLTLLDLFEKASGQRVNLAKSSVFFSSNTSSDMRHIICQRMGILEAGDHSMYLGLPNTMGRNKSAILGFLKERIRSRIQSWDGKLLSRAGKEVLLKTVVQSLPNYAMNVFLLPLEMCKEVESMMSGFWWGSSSSSSRGIRWMSWKRMSVHKHCGGMGFRNLRDFNLALLGKQGWRLLVRETSLVGKVFKARYYPKGSFLTASLGTNPSFIWRSILESQGLVAKAVRHSIGCGASTSILDDPWLPDESNPYVQSEHPGLLGKKVCQLFKEERREWDPDILLDLFNERDVELILSIPLCDSVDGDSWQWTKETYGIYSVRSAYKLAQESNGGWSPADSSGFWRNLWNLKIPPKAKNILWRATSGCLPTSLLLRSRHIEIPPVCAVCQSDQESILHALVTCPFANSCWAKSKVGVLVGPFSEFGDWFAEVLSKGNMESAAEAGVLCWEIWKARNTLVWNQKRSLVDEVVLSASLLLDQWLAAQDSMLAPPSGIWRPDDGAEHWTCPQTDVIKVNVDAAIFSSEGKFGIGCVARDGAGHLIEAFSSLKAGRVKPLEAEALGLKEALSWIKRKEWRPVVLETDCLNVVHAVRSEVDMVSTFGLIIRDCKSLLNDLCNVDLFFVKRSANKVAHYIARASCSFACCIHIGDVVPPPLLSLLLEDSLNQ